MQALMAYANGQSQEVPPFLALGELNRRKRMQSNAQAEQAKAMEGAPTVKEQLEQSTGLMALQGARQRQAASRQQGLQALTPAAAPNTTTSEPAQLASGGAINDVIGRDYQRGGPVGQMNPQMLKKLMMLKKMKQMQQARSGLGGLAGKDYAGGGMVAFQSGGLAPADEDVLRRYVEMLRRAKDADLNVDYVMQSFMKAPPEQRQATLAKMRERLNRLPAEVTKAVSLEAAPTAAPATAQGDQSMYDELQGLGRLREDRGDMTETGAERIARKQDAARDKMRDAYRKARSDMAGPADRDTSSIDMMDPEAQLATAEPSEVGVGQAERTYPRSTDQDHKIRQRGIANQQRFQDILAGREPVPQRSGPPAGGIAGLTAEEMTIPGNAKSYGASKDDPRYKAGVANQQLFQDIIYGRKPVPANDRATALAKTAPTGQDQNIVKTGGQQNPLDAMFKQYQDRLDAIEKARAGQKRSGMDDLMEYLGAIATSKRGGNWATQGAEAAQNVAKAREARRMQGDKEAMDMAKLYGDMAKDRYQLETQRQQAVKPQTIELLRDMFNSKDPQVRAFAEAYIGANKLGTMTETDILNAWNKLDIVDKKKLAQQGIVTYEQYRDYVRRTQGGQASAPAAAGNRKPISSFDK